MHSFAVGRDAVSDVLNFAHHREAAVEVESPPQRTQPGYQRFQSQLERHVR